MHLIRFGMLAVSFSATLAYADSNLSLAGLKNQVDALQQAINQQAQTNNSSLLNLQQQLQQLKTQLARFENPDLKKFNWVSVNQGLPKNAFVVANNNGSPLYLCQAAYTGDSSYNSNPALDPGVLTPKGCVITYGGQAYLAPEYAVLSSTSTGVWVDGSKIKTANRYLPIQPLFLAANGASMKAMPAKTDTNQPTPLYNQLAVIGGSENGQNVYICRVQIGGQYFVGKVTNNTCYLAAGSGEATWPSYQVLLARQP